MLKIPKQLFKLDHNQKIMNLPENVDIALKHYGIILRYNESEKRIEGDIPYMKISYGLEGVMLEIEIKRIAIMNDIPTRSLRKWCLWIADQNLC